MSHDVSYESLSLFFGRICPHEVHGEDLFKIRTRLIGTCLTIFKEILLKVNLREFKEPVKDMRQKMKEIAALPEDTYELKYRRRVRKIAYHWHLYYLTHFLFKKGGDS